MIKYLISLIIPFCFFIGLKAQYQVDLIPNELLENANEVVREHITEVDISNISHSVETGTYAVTILNKKSKSSATYSVYYSETFSKSVSLTGELYDAKGKLIKKLKKKDLRDISAVSGGNLYSDSRLLIGELEHSQYPYTVVFKYKQPRKDQILVRGWPVQDMAHQSVEKASLTIKVPSDLELNYKSLHLENSPSLSEEDKQTIYKWEANHLTPIEQEVLAPSIHNSLPVILLAITDFKWENFQGSARNWKDYGKFFYDLNEGRDKLPEELAIKVKAMCAQADDPREKINILYEFMQKNTRYVSVQLGIGGWQTYDAEYVYQNGYGDCKALTNYMKGMLKEVGIPSFTTSIYGGDEGLSFQKDFPSGQFNHVILCVPSATDTMWLECTSSENPTGYLGDFTEDRYALLNTPEGGKLVRTPNSLPEENQQLRKANVVLNKNGEAEVDVFTTFTGQQQEDLSYIILNKGIKDQEKWLRNQIEAGSFELNDFSFERAESTEIPTWFNHYRLTAKQWAGVSGSRIFLRPNVLERFNYIPPMIENRKQPILLRKPYLDIDSITYIIPSNYRIESMPEVPIKLEEEFGTYEANIVRINPQTLIYIRKLRMEKMTLPPEKYDSLRNFLKEIVKADKIQIVLSGKS